MQTKQLETFIEDNSQLEFDLLVVNKMLRELAAIEADVLSHSEAVLRGRLSKSQQQLIFDEQLKYAALAAYKPQKVSFFKYYRNIFKKLVKLNLFGIALI